MAKRKIFLIAFLASLAVCCLAACSMGGTGGTTGGNQTVDYTKTEDNAALSFTSTEKNMTIGDSFLLSPTYTRILGYTMTYSSSKPSVASVNASNGLVTALNEGTSTLTATYSNGTKSFQASMTVNCDFGGYLPQSKINGVKDGEELIVTKGSDFYLDASVLFNGVTFDDGMFSYSVADSTVASVSGQTLTASAVGTTSLVLNGSWRGKTLEKTVDLKVVPDVVFLNNGEAIGDVVLYTVAQPVAGGETYATTMPAKFTAYIEGAEYTSTAGVGATNKITVKFSKETIAKKSGTTIQALAYGTTTCTLTAAGYSRTFTITVERPTVDVDGIVPTFATDYGYYRNSAGDAATVLSFANVEDNPVDAYQGTRALTIDENGYIKGVESSIANKRGTASITVGTAKILYNFELETLAKYFASAEDLKNICITTDEYIGGYYELLGNIDATGITISHSGGGYFTGLFEGNGYTVSNLTIAPASSLFGKLYAGAKIANFGLKNLKATKANFMFGDDSSTSGLTFENIYIGLSQDTENPRGIGATTGSGFTMKNVVIEYLGTNAEADFVYSGDYRGLFLMGFWRYNDPEVKGKFILQGDYTNVYVISPYTLGFSPIDGYAADGYPNDKASKNEQVAAGTWKYAPVYAYGENETRDLYGNKPSVGNQKAETAPTYTDEKSGYVTTYNTLYFNIVVPGVRHYDTAAQCAEDKDNDYSEFNSKYWTVTGGNFVWNTAA